MSRQPVRAVRPSTSSAQLNSRVMARNLNGDAYSAYIGRAHQGPGVAVSPCDDVRDPRKSDRGRGSAQERMEQVQRRGRPGAAEDVRVYQPGLLFQARMRPHHTDAAWVGPWLLLAPGISTSNAVAR